MADQGVQVAVIAKVLRVSQATVYRWLRNRDQPVEPAASESD